MNINGEVIRSRSHFEGLCRELNRSTAATAIILAYKLKKNTIQELKEEFSVVVVLH